ncbi:hypothetical protein GALMADRAFT_245445 [Galerina marginata CBS 339.88]|uniref:Protein kinase domain-containing protein n=1 Tax=Galerina marginata (strain CBS 339.88) TaxID=685588 RepID=A0A067T556_GALM3|nr:hypothetical protein GALMADRAFT_245445 [Galerina marginata CBS 339.88]
MAFPQSFSTTVDCPLMENSPSTVTVRLSTSSNPVASLMPRRVSFSAGVEGQAKARPQADSVAATKPTPPTQLRSRFSPTRMTQSGSIASLLMSVRSRSRSKTGHSDGERDTFKQETPMAEPVTSWFGKACELIRPWEDSDEEEIPDEQKQAFAQTRDAVGATLKRIFRCAGPIALEALVVSIELMEYVPVPALQGISKTFTAIWKAVQQVSMNRLAFLRLVQTCTTILDSIYKEVEGSDEFVSRELAGPILVLERSFESLLSLITSQTETPFLVRYLKRDDTTKALSTCNDSLLRALTLFTTTIQIRTYQAVCANAQLSAANNNMMMEIISQGLKGHPNELDPSNPAGQLKRASVPNLDGLPSSSSHRSLGISASPTIVSHSVDDLLSRPQVMPVLQQIQSAHNIHDAKSDVEDLRRSIKAALESGNDAKLLSFLGIEAEEMPEAIKTLQRTLEKRSKPTNGKANDTLHEEFLESGIDALRRMSAGSNFANLPFWTITKYEVERKQKIGMGFFSEVFQGTWKGRTVAIKVLSEVTPSDLFVREIKVWKSFIHPNVLKLYGASSATGSHPWFFVSPYMKNGNLVEFLRRISQHEEFELQGLGSIAENLPSSRSRGSYGKAFVRILKLGDVYRILQEIVEGMNYLHRMNVLHGDLKASNVLVDDHCRCVISDFGQSEMKSEVCRITGSSMQAGTLRWKAPELLDGTSSLTPATDIYAFAIVCIEVLTMGDLPWAHDDDDEVRHNVLERDKRPLIPPDFTSPLLHELIATSWARDPSTRTPFSETIGKLQRLRVIAGEGSDPSIPVEAEMSPRSQASPTCLSPLPISPTASPYSESTLEFFDDYVALPSAQEVDALRMEDTLLDGMNKITEPVVYLQHQPSLTSPVYGTSASESDCDVSLATLRGCHSPPPSNDAFAEARNERRYRYLLEHDFNSSLTLPLWSPSHVQLGDVGYLSKPSGCFVTLFNALQRNRASGGLAGSLPTMAGYGNVAKGQLRLDKRNVAQKGIDAFSGLLALRTRGDLPITRRHSFRLHAGHKCAHLYTESAEYHYLKKLDAPKSWFQANVDVILKHYGREHNIQKEDLLLVISMLQAPNYALFVNHQHPDGQAHFNVFSSAKKGRPWGNFTTDTTVPGVHNGPVYEEVAPEGHEYSSKVSNANGPPKAILLGRLRFKPDSMDATTAK